MKISFVYISACVRMQYIQRHATTTTNAEFTITDVAPATSTTRKQISRLPRLSMDSEEGRQKRRRSGVPALYLRSMFISSSACIYILLPHPFL